MKNLSATPNFLRPPTKMDCEEGVLDVGMGKTEGGM